MKRNKSGISLIVLVITIIVMVVLAAAVVISLSQNGIILKANEAAQKMSAQEIKAVAQTAWLDVYVKGNATKEELQAAVNKALENVDTTGYDVIVDEKGVNIIPEVQNQKMEAGLYDESNKLVATWSELINDYGVDFSARYYSTMNSDTALSNIISNNSMLQSGVLLKTADNYTTIEGYAFANCTSLKHIILADTVTTIGNNVFENCTSLESLIIPDNISSVDVHSFLDCPVSLYNEYDNACYMGSENNPYLIFIQPKNMEITSCKINSKTRFLPKYAFSGCKLLTSVTIPAGMTTLLRSGHP